MILNAAGGRSAVRSRPNSQVTGHVDLRAGQAWSQSGPTGAARRPVQCPGRAAFVGSARGQDESSRGWPWSRRRKTSSATTDRRNGRAVTPVVSAKPVAQIILLCTGVVTELVASHVTTGSCDNLLVLDPHRHGVRRGRRPGPAPSAARRPGGSPRPGPLRRASHPCERQLLDQSCYRTPRLPPN